MAKADLGIKRRCPNCGAKYYDLNRSPIICPRCGTEFDVPAVRSRPAAAAPVAVEVDELPVEAGAEVISLEEADAEAAGGVEEAADGDEAEVAAGDEEDVFLEPEEGEEDVSGIIGEVDEEER